MERGPRLTAQAEAQPEPMPTLKPNSGGFDSPRTLYEQRNEPTKKGTA